MKGIRLFITIYLSIIFSLIIQADQPDYIEGNLLVKINSNSTIISLKTSLKIDYDLSIETKKLSDLNNIWLIKFDPLKIEATELMNELSGNYDFIDIVQLNHSNIKKRDTIPNDPFMDKLWQHINNVSGGVDDADMDSELAWRYTTGGLNQKGQKIVVAIIDEGIDLNHEDLTLWTNQNEIPNNNIDDDNNGYVDDIHGYDFWDNDGNPDISGSWESHGTHVAGIVGANGNNCIGIAGVNWNVEIMAIRGSSTEESVVIQAYEYALKMRKLFNQSNGALGANIVVTNSSFGVDYGNPADYPLWCEYYNLMGEEGILSAVAGPNLSINIDNEGDVPGTCPSDYTICVTNTKSNDDIAFAGYGEINVDIGAPGSSIYSTLPNNVYGNKSGTSMATPQVAGAIALMHSAICENIIDTKTNSELASYIKSKILNEGVDQTNALEGKVLSEGRLNLHKCLSSVSSLYDISVTNTNCNQNSGTVSIISDGVPTSYIWESGNTSSSREGLSEGNYMVTMVNVDNCKNIENISVSNDIEIAPTITNNKCSGLTLGEISLSPSGGNTPYAYLWNNTSTSSINSDLESGKYRLTVTSLDGCEKQYSFNVIDSLSLQNMNAFVQQDTCEANAGRIIVPKPEETSFLSGNCNEYTTTILTSSPYSYLWNNSATTDTLNNLTKGNYSLTLTTGEGCFFDTTFTINSLIAPGSLEVYDSIMNITCNGDNDGWIRIDSILGGYSPFSYQWNNAKSTAKIENLTANEYLLTITDSKGCLQYKQFNLLDPDSIAIALLVTQMSEKDANDAQIESSVSGGNGLYSYAWSNNETSAVISNLGYGEYTLTVTDFKNCSNSSTAAVDYISFIASRINKAIIDIFPNPVNELINIKPYENSNTIKIFNHLGQQVIQDTKGTINASILQNGIYLILIENNNGEVIYSQKIIKL